MPIRHAGEPSAHQSRLEKEIQRSLEWNLTGSNQQLMEAEPRNLDPSQPTSLFCFALVMPFGDEASLLSIQQLRGLGVFGCDDHIVFSNVSGEVLFGRQAPSVHVAVLPGPLAVPRDPGDGAYFNAGTFIKVWNHLTIDSRFEGYDWTIKVDVDTILVPHYLRGLLRVHCQPCRPLYLQDSADTMHGPIQVVSRAGMKYFLHYEKMCSKDLSHEHRGEAEYLEACFESLMIPAESEPNLLLQVDDGQACDDKHASFHPFRSWETAVKCLQQTGFFQEPPRIDNEISAPSLFCFALVMPSSAETMLVAQQYLTGVGIFSCDSYMIFSNVSSKDLFRQGFRPNRWPGDGPAVTVVEGNLQVPLSRQYFTPLNGPAFIQVWDHVFRDSRFRKADWTLKFDADAVFLPGRLRELLWTTCPLHGQPCGAVLVANVGQHLHGPVEALSRKAVEKFSAGANACKASIEYLQKGENLYLAECLRQLDVDTIQLPELLEDVGWSTDPKCSRRHAVHHAFKFWDSYMGCLAQAGYILPGPVQDGDRWSLPQKLETPSMFCWALVQHSGPELQLTLRQQKEGVGIFSCEEHLIVSNASLTGAFGAAAGQVRMAVISAYLFAPIGGKYMTALNSPVFIKAWHAVFEDHRFRLFDWTLKMDPDTVFVPGRVRELLHRHCRDEPDCSAKYLTNFGGDIHGPVEVLSNRAMQRYAVEEHKCTSQVDYSDKGEDWYLGLCMEVLGVPGEEEPSLLSDWHLDSGTPSPCDTMHATFHPFKSWEYYYRCLCESGHDTQVCARMMVPTTVTHTSTTTSSTTTSSRTTRTSSSTSTFSTLTRTMTLPMTTSTRSTTKPIVAATSTTTETENTMIFFDGRAGKGSGSGDSGTLSFQRTKYVLPIGVAAAGIFAGLGIGFLATFVSRKLRARRMEAMFAAPVPTSLSESAETRVLESGTAATFESAHSFERLLGGRDESSI